MFGECACDLVRSDAAKRYNLRDLPETIGDEDDEDEAPLSIGEGQ